MPPVKCFLSRACCLMGGRSQRFKAKDAEALEDDATIVLVQQDGPWVLIQETAGEQLLCYPSRVMTGPGAGACMVPQSCAHGLSALRGQYQKRVEPEVVPEDGHPRNTTG